MKRIGIIGGNSIEYINILIDIWNAGHCAVLIDYQTPVYTILEIFHNSQVHECYIEDKLLKLFSFEQQQLLKFNSYTPKSNSIEQLPLPIYQKFHPNYTTNEAVIIFSSGTTGKAKGVILSHYSLNTNADAIIDYMNLTPHDSLYIVKPFFHSSTLTGELLVALKAQIKTFIAPLLVPPRFVLQNIHKYHVTIICINPQLLMMYLNEYKNKKYDISPLHTIYVSGAILTNKVYNLAHTTLPSIKIYNVYGMTEAGPRISAQRIDCCKSNSVGKPLQNISILIMDDNGNILPVNKKGTVYVKTPSVYSGYTNYPCDNLSHSWLNTGDIGYLDEYDELHIVGRVDNIINLNSHKITPSTIEERICDLADIEECIVIKEIFNDKEILSCLYTANRPIDINQLKKALKNFLLPYEIPCFFLSMFILSKITNWKTPAFICCKTQKKISKKTIIIFTILFNFV